MNDEPSLRRQWILLKALSSRRLGLTVREMAAELNVADKTIRRDLALFRRVGFPLEETVGEFGRKTWRMSPTGCQPPLSFAFDEAVALYLGRRLLDPLAGTAFGDSARRASEKVRASLSRPALAYLDQFARSFQPTAFGTHEYAQHSEMIDALQVAIEDCRVTRLLYQSERESVPTDREVHPLAAIFHRGTALYLVALDPGEGRIKHYKIDRIKEAEALARPFVRPEGFDLNAHLSATFGVYQRDGEPTTVKVRFAPAAACYVRESQWHASQHLTDEADGGVLAEFRLSSTEELKRWVLGFGARAVVLEPESLRREIAEELRSLVSIYEAADPDGTPRRGREAARRPRPKPLRHRSGVHADD